MDKLGKVNIDWSYVSVESWNPSDEYEAKDIIMTIERHPSERNVNNSYDLERALLDMVGETDFIHRTFELSIFTVGVIYVEFTATQIRIGASGGYRRS